MLALRYSQQWLYVPKPELTRKLAVLGNPSFTNVPGRPSSTKQGKETLKVYLLKPILGKGKWAVP